MAPGPADDLPPLDVSYRPMRGRPSRQMRLAGGSAIPPLAAWGRRCGL